MISLSSSILEEYKSPPLALYMPVLPDKMRQAAVLDPNANKQFEPFDHFSIRG
jgi:hypothetical protein